MTLWIRKNVVTIFSLSVLFFLLGIGKKNELPNSQFVFGANESLQFHNSTMLNLELKNDLGLLFNKHAAGSGNEHAFKNYGEPGKKEGGGVVSGKLFFMKGFILWKIFRLFAPKTRRGVTGSDILLMRQQGGQKGFLSEQWTCSQVMLWTWSTANL